MGVLFREEVYLVYSLEVWEYIVCNWIVLVRIFWVNSIVSDILLGIWLVDNIGNSRVLRVRFIYYNLCLGELIGVLRELIFFVF